MILYFPLFNALSCRHVPVVAAEVVRPQELLQYQQTLQVQFLQTFILASLHFVKPELKKHSMSKG